MAELTKVAEIGDLPAGRAMAVEASGRRIALFNVDGTIHAIDDTCTHRGGPLSEGELEGTTVTCPWHGARFDVTSGSVIGPPAGSDVTSYRVEIDGADIKLELP